MRCGKSDSVNTNESSQVICEQAPPVHRQSPVLVLVASRRPRLTCRVFVAPPASSSLARPSAASCSAADRQTRSARSPRQTDQATAAQAKPSQAENRPLIADTSDQLASQPAPTDAGCGRWPAEFTAGRRLRIGSCWLWSQERWCGGPPGRSCRRCPRCAWAMRVFLQPR